MYIRLNESESITITLTHHVDEDGNLLHKSYLAVFHGDILPNKKDLRAMGKTPEIAMTKLAYVVKGFARNMRAVLVAKEMRERNAVNEARVLLNTEGNLCT